jgi:hypothetical protein
MPFEIASEHGFTHTVAVAIRVVKVVDSIFQRTINDGVGLLFVQCPHSHAPKGDGRSGSLPADTNIFHGLQTSYINRVFAPAPMRF